MANWTDIVCRVCGETFEAQRVDATACSGRCRQRLRRGGEFAYFADLTEAQRQKERERHAGYDEQIREHRAEQREAIQRRARNRRERQIIKALGLTRRQLEQLGRATVVTAAEAGAEERRAAASLERVKRDLARARGQGT